MHCFDFISHSNSFARADSEIPLVITGLVRVSTLGGAEVLRLITLGDDATLLLFALFLPHTEEDCSSRAGGVEEDVGQMF